MYVNEPMYHQSFVDLFPMKVKQILDRIANTSCKTMQLEVKLVKIIFLYCIQYCQRFRVYSWRLYDRKGKWIYVTLPTLGFIFANGGSGKGSKSRRESWQRVCYKCEPETIEKANNVVNYLKKYHLMIWAEGGWG